MDAHRQVYDYQNFHRSMIAMASTAENTVGLNLYDIRQVINSIKASTMRGSQLRPPSRIPATSGLLEMSASDHNARAMMPPPASLKHKGSGRKMVVLMI